MSKNNIYIFHLNFNVQLVYIVYNSILIKKFVNRRPLETPAKGVLPNPEPC